MPVVAWVLKKDASVKRAIVIGATIAVAIDLIFRLALNVNLPSGVLDITTA